MLLFPSPGGGRAGVKELYHERFTDITCKNVHCRLHAAAVSSGAGDHSGRQSGALSTDSPAAAGLGKVGTESAVAVGASGSDEQRHGGDAGSLHPPESQHAEHGLRLDRTYRTVVHTGSQNGSGQNTGGLPAVFNPGAISAVSGAVQRGECRAERQRHFRSIQPFRNHAHPAAWQ